MYFIVKSIKSQIFLDGLLPKMVTKDHFFFKNNEENN